jgi:hypothetical protein
MPIRQRHTQQQYEYSTGKALIMLHVRNISGGLFAAGMVARPLVFSGAATGRVAE